MTVNKLTSPISQNDLINKTNEIIDNLGGGGATDVQINGTSITSNNVANIVTNTAYDATSNKIATMSDLPADKIFVAEYNVTSYADVLAAYNAGKTIVCLRSTTNVDYYYKLYYKTSSGFMFTSCAANDIFTISLSETSGWLSLNTTTLQPTSTAVTHTNSTQVGNSTKPIYISSTGAATASSSTVGGSSTPVYLNAGTITSTGLSIASSRFDGQWVAKHVTLADGVSMGNATIKTYSLASYLPDATYDYEVMFSGLVITAASSGKFLKMILDSSVVSNVWVCDARTRTSSTMEATGSCIIPISKNSQQIVMKSESSSNSSGTMSLAALAYRRIGTNT